MPSGKVPLITSDKVVEALSRALSRPLDPTSLRVTRIPTGKFNDSFFVSGHAMDVVIRIAPPDTAGRLFYERNMMAQEPEIHRLLLEKTQVPVPRILAYDTTRHVLDRDFLVMERLPGRPLTEVSPLTLRRLENVFRQMGQHLAQVHAITAQKYGYLGAHHPMDPADSWAAAFRAMWNKLIDDIVSWGGYAEDEAKQMRLLLADHLSLFDRPVNSSLLHMDIWHQNILIDEDDRVTGILDWDRALWGDPEIEFAVLDYCGVSTPAFWKGYGHERDTSPPARTRGIFYLLYEVQKHIVIERARRLNAHAADAHKRRAFALAQNLNET